MRLPALPLLLLAAPASAQFTPFQEIGLSLVSSRDVQVVDFDGDGVPDLIAPDRATRQIVLYLGLGGGAFDQGRLLGGGPVTTMDPGPTVVAAGDLDGDGDPDIVALSEEGQSVVLENLGNGTTGAPIPLPNVPNARTSFSLSIQLYDIDGDGRLDVVQSTGGPGSGNSGGTYYQLNLGGLTFGLRRQLTQSFEPGGVAKFGDIDGDGDDDTLVNHPSGRDLYWIRNDGALPRTVLTALPWNPSFGTLLDAELGDIDQDGDLDVLAAGSTIDRIYLFENDGAGQFAAFTVAVAGNGTVGDFELVDLEGDGDLDVVWTRNPGGRRLQWVENLGGGTFSSVRTIQGGLGFWRIQVADLDQDGVLDIVAQEPQQTYWLRGSLANPVPSFGPPIAVDQVEIARLVDVALTDVDLDADLDVVGVTFPSGSFAFAENVGEGEFLNPTIEATGLGESYRGLRTADLDGDGDLDFAPIPISNTQLYWFENPGDFTVGSRVVIQSTGDNEIDLQFADVDGDGDLDAVTLARLGGAGVLSWVSNPGDGSFGAATAIATLPAGAGSLQIGDMDLDGVVDLFATDAGPVARVVFLRGLGAGTFASPVSVLPSGSGRVLAHFALVDVDVDGFLDVVQVRELFSGDRIEWVRNVGGVFVATATEIQTVVEGFSGVQGADLDGDGDDDLLLSDGNGFDGAVWLENPTFSIVWPVHELTIPGTTINGADVGDIDCDGDLDVAVAPDQRNVGVFENLLLGPIGGPFVCGPATPNSTGVPGRLALVGDVRVIRNRVTLQAHELPPNVFGFFLTSQFSGSTFPVPGSIGRLCLTGSVGRFVGPGQVLDSGAAGTFCLPIDLNVIPQPTGSVQVMAGSRWFFQAWHRDVSGGGVVSNFTAAAGVTFE